MIRILVAQISRQSTPVEQERATTSLLALTRSADNRAKIAAAGAIPRLVALLGTQSTAAVQVAAALVLEELALDADNLLAIKSDPHTLPFLYKMRGTSASFHVRLAAKSALQRLNRAPLEIGGIRSDKAGKRANKPMAAEEKTAKESAAAAKTKPVKRKASKTTVEASSLAAQAQPAASSSDITSHQAGPSLHPDPSAYESTLAPSAAAAPSKAASQQLPPRLGKGCWSCGATGVRLKKCSVCAVAAYCGASCQNADWMAHKGQCAGLKAGAASVPASTMGP